MAEYCVHYKDDIDRIFVRCYFCVGKHSWYACPQHLPQFNVVMKNVLVQTQMNRVQFRTTPALKCWKGFKQL